MRAEDEEQRSRLRQLWLEPLSRWLGHRHEEGDEEERQTPTGVRMPERLDEPPD